MMTSVRGMESDEEILLRKVCSTNSTTLPSSCFQPPVLSASSVLLSNPLIGTTVVPTQTAKVTAHVRTMADSHASRVASRDMIDNSVCHSDSTEFEMPFGIDDDDLVNYQPPVIYSSRSSSVKYFNNRTSSKSFDIETFEEEDLNLHHSRINDSIFYAAR